MEEEINYSTVVFKNDHAAPTEKKEEQTIYSEVKPKTHEGEAASTSKEKEEQSIYSEVKPKTPEEAVTISEEEAAPASTDGEAAACSLFRVLALCLGILCLLLVVSIGAIIYISLEMSKDKTNLSEVKAENRQLSREKRSLERETEEQSRVTDDLNRTLGVILTFNNFPVNDFCPDKKCQPCRRGWTPFQDKCYLFYDKPAPWKTWRESREYCQNTAADLVIIDSLHEQEFISNHSKYYHDQYHGFWLGLMETKDKDWVWLDGRNDTQRYWITGVFGDGGPCALVIPNRTPTASWDPAMCSMQNKFICEHNSLVTFD